MPRASREEQARNHERILEAAARLVRERGTDGFSVPEVMGAVGLTRGGFYKHFSSKEDLVAQAEGAAFAAHAASLPTIEGLEPAADVSARSRFLDVYLSTGHRDHPGVGCPAAALAGDLGRPGIADGVRRTYAKGVQDLLDRLQDLGDGDAAAARIELATMVGAVLLARATVGEPLSEQFLTDAREHLESADR